MSRAPQCRPDLILLIAATPDRSRVHVGDLDQRVARADPLSSCDESAPVNPSTAALSRAMAGVVSSLMGIAHAADEPPDDPALDRTPVPSVGNWTEMPRKPSPIQPNPTMPVPGWFGASR
jgi:hypothetical protein